MAVFFRSSVHTLFDFLSMRSQIELVFFHAVVVRVTIEQLYGVTFSKSFLM